MLAFSCQRNNDAKLTGVIQLMKMPRHDNSFFGLKIIYINICLL